GSVRGDDPAGRRRRGGGLRRRHPIGIGHRIRLRAAHATRAAADPRGCRGRRLRPAGCDLAQPRRHRRHDPQPQDGVVSALAAERRRAIDQSGWGEDFRLVQPRNLAFWVYCALVVAGAYVLFGQVSIAAAAYSGALVSGIVAFGLLAIAYLWFIRYEDRYTTVPPRLAGAGFVWGFVAATGAFALLANGDVIDLYAKTFGASFAFDWGPALAAPIDEELAKGAGVLLLLTLAPRLIRSPFDGLILGAFIGLGFQISEDISYAWIGAANSFNDVGAAWSTIIVRTLASIPSHWMYTAIFGAGLVWFIGRPDVPARRWLGAGLMLTAMLMHGLWDASAAIGGAGMFGWIVPAVVAGVLITVFVWVYQT